MDPSSEDIVYWKANPAPSDEGIAEMCLAWVRYQQTHADTTVRSFHERDVLQIR